MVSKKLLNEYRNYKFKKTGSTRISINEAKALEKHERFLNESKHKRSETSLSAVRRAPLSRKTNSFVRQPASAMRESIGFKIFCKDYVNHKKEKGANPRITEKEHIFLRRAYLNEQKERNHTSTKSFKALVENYKKYKEERGIKEAVSYSELRYLKESYKANPRLAEADQNFDIMNQDGMNQENINQEEVSINPALSASIQAAVAAVGNVAQTAGVAQVQDDLGADPNAGIPPIQGVDPNNAQRVPMAESEKMIKIRSRIAERAKFLENNLDGELTSAATKSLPKIPHLSTGLKSDKKNDVGQLSNMPTPAAFAAGFAGKNGATLGKTWPTRHTGTDMPLQGKGSEQNTKVNESDEHTDFETINEKYIDKYYAPKLSFDKLSEMLKVGNLG